MKKTRNTWAVMFLIAVCAAFSAANALAQNDIEAHRSCANCGMDRKAFGYSRMLIRFEDGTEVGVCSLHCAVIELAANKDRKVKALLVADRDTRDLIDAEHAVWVAGGSKPGVMTGHPSWAFRTREAAQAFIKKYGGVPASWQDVLSQAREEAAKEGR